MDDDSDDSEYEYIGPVEADDAAEATEALDKQINLIENMLVSTCKAFPTHALIDSIALLKAVDSAVTEGVIAHGETEGVGVEHPGAAHLVIAATRISEALESLESFKTEWIKLIWPEEKE